jgi:hypothetical protein
MQTRDINNPKVSLSIEKDESGKFKQAILCVSKNSNMEKFTFSHSAKITRCHTKKSMEWDKLKDEIDTTNKEINKQRQNRSLKTDEQTDKEECMRQKKEMYYNISILANERAVKLNISDGFDPNNRRNNAKCFRIEPYDNC